MKKYFHKTPFWLKWAYPGLLWKERSGKKEIFLTFDDGPTTELTPWILETLSAFNAKATFFCVGQNIQENPDLFEQMLNEGHHVANHTFNHKNGWNTPAMEYLENIYQCEREISQPGNKLFRPPYGRITSRQIRRVKKAGYKIVMWDVLSGDFDGKITAESCFYHSKIHTEPGSIVVFHDNVKSGHILKNALPDYLYFLKQNNFQTSLWK